MKKQRLGWLVGWMWMLLCLAGCEKAPVNDAIEGHWKLERMTTLHDGKVTECERLYYSITYMVTEVAEKQGTHQYGTFVARTDLQEGKLILKDFKVRKSTSDSGESATIEQLLPFGINNPEQTTFEILESSRHHLVLASDYARLALKKF